MKEQKKTLINQIWIYLAFECSIIISKYKKENQRIEKAKSDSENTKDKLTSEIELLKTANTELRTQTVNTKEAVDSINQILKNTGFQGFEIKEKDSVNNITQYYLARTTNPSEADVFQKLSEGEKNFIAFLYFYQLCLGSTDLENPSNKKKILVIDDPVSSMDSQSLFIVSTIIQNLIQRNEKSKNELVKSSISQVLILTHNLYFYKEISLNCRPICNDRMHYKIYKNSCNETVIEREKKDYKALDDSSFAGRFSGLKSRNFKPLFPLK